MLYYNKYILYKKKYLNLQNIIGGTCELIIYNFSDYEKPSVAEVISYGYLNSKMTSH